MDDPVPSERRWGRAAVIGGSLAIVVPVAGWLAPYLAITFTSSGDAIGFGLVTSVVLGVLGLVAWIAGLYASICGMRASGTDRRLALAGGVLCVLAPIVCCAEWAVVTTQFQFMQF